MQVLLDLVHSITLAGAVDILIIASLFYFGLVWIRGTRAFQILATMAVIGLLYLVASRMGLVMTSFLFQYLWAAIIIVLVIVFQPEIRQMLDRASPIRYLSGTRSTAVEPTVLDETVRAVGELARTRTGALIVFRRLDRLEDFLLIGTRLDSLVSAEALLTIFQKHSPLHDGAVLISGDRIRAASCILPLSTDESLASRYGTRHRAALGLTERSDAMCVVVSEERGEVSLAENKTLRHFSRKGEFRTELERGLAGRNRATSVADTWIGGLILANWKSKLIALAAALTLWVAIVGPQRTEVGVSVPIQYTNLPAGMEITGKWMDRVDVRLRGSEASLTSLRPGAVKAVVDLSNIVSGLNFYRISERDLQVPPGVTIAKIRPSDLRLTVTASSTKSFPVKPDLVGELAPEYAVTVSPAEVRVRALPEVLKQVTSVETDPVNATELVEKGRLTIPVSVRPSGLMIDAIEPLQVTVLTKAPAR